MRLTIIDQIDHNILTYAFIHAELKKIKIKMMQTDDLFAPMYTIRPIKEF